jgi:hypothetical protein
MARVVQADEEGVRPAGEPARARSGDTDSSRTASLRRWTASAGEADPAGSSAIS